MKRGFILVAIAFVAFLVVLGYESSDNQYSIDVTGTNGIAFTGSCMTTTVGSSYSQDASGLVPASFETSGTIVSCGVQKQGEEGMLRLRIRRDGKTIAEGSTSQPYGMVTVAGQ
ncbi:MAG: hypothetical protein AB7M05_03015 [Alphaproteobacteria bacterium]